MEYDPTQFRGTAPFYLRGRPPYSAELAEVLQRELQLDGSGRLVDIGCGPGTVGVELASLFEHVTFVEPDPDLLAAARAHAASSGLTAVDFRRGTAEDLPINTGESARVATFGQSFHRTDRMRAAQAVHDVLAPGGSIVLVTHAPDRPAPPPPPDTVPIPHDEIRALIHRYLGDELRSGARPASAYSTERFEQTLARTRFSPPRTVFAAGRPDLVRDVDAVVANYLSMSFASPHRFGERTARFVDDLRDLLREHAPHGRFWDWPGDTELVIATRT